MIPERELNYFLSYSPCLPCLPCLPYLPCKTSLGLRTRLRRTKVGDLPCRKLRVDFRCKCRRNSLFQFKDSLEKKTCFRITCFRIIYFHKCSN